MDLVIRAFVIYFVVLVFVRIIGKRELSTLQPFDLILLVVIGDLVQQGVTQNDQSVTGVLLVLSTIAATQVAVSYLTFRIRRLRPVFEGEPVVLMGNGEIIEKNLKRERLTHADLAEAARKNGVEQLDEVKWAVLETNGEISIIKSGGD